MFLQCAEVYKELVVEIIGFVGVIISILVGASQFKKQSWCDNVSKERMKWIVDFREEVGIISATVVMFQSEKLKKICDTIDNNDDISHNGINTNKNYPNEYLYEKLFQAENAKNRLITRINIHKVKGNEFNKSYMEMLRKLHFFNINTIKDFNYELFMLITNSILEVEWQKVKREAKGKL